MAEHYTSNIQLAYPDFGTTNWNTDVENNYVKLDGSAAVGPLAVTFTEVPSASLNVKVAAGSYTKGDKTAGTYAGSSSFALTASNTNYLYLTDGGTLTTNTAAFPSNTNIVPLATCVVGASTVTSIADSRKVFVSRGGHPADGFGVPTVVANTGAGSGPTVSILSGGSDAAGTVSVLTGSAPANTTSVVTVTFGFPYATVPRSVIVTPGNSLAAGLSGNAQVWADQASTNTTTWVIKVGSTALAATNTYLWQYRVSG